MFFNKILDFFKIENLYKKESAQHQSGKLFSSSIASSDILYEIISYWEQHDLLTGEFVYHRNATFNEKKDFALISILSSFSKKARDPNYYSPLILNELGITNWNAYMQRLTSKGYIQKADIIEILDAQYKLPDLKIIADSLGIKKTGKKKELTQRIASSLSEDQIYNIRIDCDLYTLSDKGKQKLLGCEDYVSFYRYRHSVSLAEFNDMRKPEGGRYIRDFYDTMFQIFSNRVFYYECNHNYARSGVESFNIYRIMIEEFKNTDHNVPLDVALVNYVQHLYDSLCYSMQVYYSVKNGICPNSTLNYLIPPPDKDLGIVADHECFINYDAIFVNRPPCFLKHDEFQSYVHELLTSPMFNQQKWSSIINQRVNSLFDIIRQC